MTARLGGQPIHPVLGTASLVEAMEWAGRQLLLPYLEPEEEAVGYAIELVHRHPTAEGERFRVWAEFVRRDGNLLVARVWGENARGRMAEGMFTQALIQRREFEQRIQKWRAAADASSNPV